MSSASSAVTYTSVYTDSEPGRVFWGADEEIPDGGFLRVIVYGYDELPMQPVDPPSPDYVPGPEHPSSPDYVPGPEHPPSPIEIPYVPEPEYPKYLVPSEDEAPMEDQPLPIDASPVALSPGYVPNSDPEEIQGGTRGAFADTLTTRGGIEIDDASDDDTRDTEAFETDESAPTPRPPQIRIPFAQTRLCRARKTFRPEPPMSASMWPRHSPGSDRVRVQHWCCARQSRPTPEVDTWDEIVEAMMEIAPTTLEGVDQRVTELDTTVRQRTEEFQAVYARIAWTGSEERSAAIEAHVRTLEAQVATLIAQTTSLQTQLTTTLGRIATLEARDPEPQDGPAEAGSSC
ncbi:hypothetical protein Tco_1228151 [Tanacetum coccineum]